MATLAQTILEGAWSLRTANDPDKLATKRELLLVLQNFLQWMSGWITRRNPEFLGTWSAEAFATLGVWSPPSSLSTVLAAKSGTGGATKILAAGVRIYIVPRTDLQAEIAPAIYRDGVGYKTRGGTGDPVSDATGDKVSFLTAGRFASLDITKDPSDVSNTLDARWPEAYNTLPMLYLGKYLARKDGRDANELGAIQGEIDSMLALLEEELQIANYGVSARFGQQPRAVPTAPTMRP